MSEEGFVKIEKAIKNYKYDLALFLTVKELLPKSAKFQTPSKSSEMVQLLVSVYKLSPKLYEINPLKKATLMVYIADCLNSKNTKNFIPEHFYNVKRSTGYQQLASAYIQQAFEVLSKNAIVLPFERVVDLNYLYNIIEMNLCIISLAEKGRLYGYTDVYNNLKKIDSRLDILIKRDPRPEFYSARSTLLTYLGREGDATQLLRDSLKVSSLTLNLRNLDVLGYKIHNVDRLVPVEIYN